ncbi:unnamed protein product [Choristocarpus tenellus]
MLGRVVGSCQRYLSVLPSSSSRQTLAKDTYLAFPKQYGVLDRTTVRSLLIRLPLLFRGEFETGVYPDEMHWREGISRDEAPREIVNSWKADRTVARVVLSADLGKLATILGGWQSVRVAQDDIVWKPPGCGPVAYHQDSAYISKQFSPADNNSLTVWIALDDTDESVGTIEYATFSPPPPGSSTLRPPQPPLPSLNSSPAFHGADPLTYRAPAKAAAAAAATEGGRGLALSFQPISVGVGGCVVHLQDAWHGSGPNLSESRHRRALVVHFLRGDAVFIDGSVLEGSAGPTYIYGRYKRNGRNMLPEEAFPVTYSTDGYRTPWIDEYLRAGEGGQ